MGLTDHCNSFWPQTPDMRRALASCQSYQSRAEMAGLVGWQQDVPLLAQSAAPHSWQQDAPLLAQSAALPGLRPVWSMWLLGRAGSVSDLITTDGHRNWERA